MRRLFAFLLFLLFVFLGQRVVERSRLSDGVRSICDLVDQHFYKVDSELFAWLKDCRSLASEVRPWHSQEAVVERVQWLMDGLRVSHFQIFTPSEDKKIWRGEAVDTGVRARWVEDRLVVFKVLRSSGAEKAGLRAGDDILRIDGSDRISPWRAQNVGGEFIFKRAEQVLTAVVVATPLQVDEGPQLKKLNARTGLLTISSFRAEYFRGEDWLDIVEGFREYDALVIDVRDNAGGNFVAMLRALSTFFCEPQEVGTLVQPRKAGQEPHEFNDETSDEYQISELDRYRAIRLKTFRRYGCFQKSLTVLVNADTASVSEIFAEALRTRERTRVWGLPTAGDVVLAVWYDLPLLGRGFSISIPEAVYLNPEGEELEGKGIWPEKELYYNLDEALAGQDNWLREAAEK